MALSPCAACAVYVPRAAGGAADVQQERSPPVEAHPRDSLSAQPVCNAPKLPRKTGLLQQGAHESSAVWAKGASIEVGG